MNICVHFCAYLVKIFINEKIDRTFKILLEYTKDLQLLCHWTCVALRRQPGVVILVKRRWIKRALYRFNSYLYGNSRVNWPVSRSNLRCTRRCDATSLRPYVGQCATLGPSVDVTTVSVFPTKCTKWTQRKGCANTSVMSVWITMRILIELDTKSLH